MSAFCDGLKFGFAQGMLDNMFRFGGFFSTPFGCCCRPFNVASLFMVPRMNINLFQYPTIVPQINLPQSYNTLSFDTSVPKTQTITNLYVPKPVVDFSKTPFYAAGDTFIKEKKEETVKKTDETAETQKAASEVKAKDWSKMTDAELKEVYGNYDRDITSEYDGSAEDLNKYIETHLAKDSVLRGMGQAFIDAQNKYGISASVLLAICIFESNGGTSKLAKSEKHNVSSYTTGKKGSDRWKDFDSVENCIDMTAALLKNHYVTNADNAGRSLTKLYEINSKYCPVAEVTENSRWASSVESITNKIESDLA